MKDVEHGMRCVYYCKPGYELRGPRYTTCNNTQWSEPSPVSCVRGRLTSRLHIDLRQWKAKFQWATRDYGVRVNMKNGINVQNFTFPNVPFVL